MPSTIAVAFSAMILTSTRYKPLLLSSSSLFMFFKSGSFVQSEFVGVLSMYCHENKLPSGIH